jgi:hypothetical protein
MATNYAKFKMQKNTFSPLAHSNTPKKNCKQNSSSIFGAFISKSPFCSKKGVAHGVCIYLQQ